MSGGDDPSPEERRRAVLLQRIREVQRSTEQGPLVEKELEAAATELARLLGGTGTERGRDLQALDEARGRKRAPANPFSADRPHSAHQPMGAVADLQHARELWCARQLRVLEGMCDLLHAGDGAAYLAAQRRYAIGRALGGDGAETDAEVDELLRRRTLAQLDEGET